jgi:HTH-type transcriptional regulator/antitoxin HigA
MTTTVHERVRERLQRKRKSQRWLASQLGISESYLSELLAGKRRMSLDLALRLHEQTGVPVRELSEVA